jgi:hypothetical protein
MPVDKLTVKKLKVEKQLILPSKLFLKDKYRPDGGCDKFKARLVAGVHRQNHDDYESTSCCRMLPTTHSTCCWRSALPSKVSDLSAFEAFFVTAIC